MKIKRMLVFTLAAMVAAFAFVATSRFTTRVAAVSTTVPVTECSIARQAENTPPSKNWVLYTRIPPGGATGTFVTGPGTPPEGVGSLQLQTPTSGDKVFIFNYDHIGTTLASINEMSYATYRFAGGNTNQLPAINLQVNPNEPNSPSFTTLVFEPIYNLSQQAIQTNTWQTWDAYNGGNAVWWSTRDLRDSSGNLIACNPNGALANTPQCAGKLFVSWSTIVAGLPNATISGGFGINAGSGNAGLTAATDALTIGSGSNSVTYDFEPDADADCVADSRDNCPNVANANQADNDNDGDGDVCDTDDDNDGVPDTSDNCPLISNANQVDTDGDGLGNACDPDDDNDGVADGGDNCPLTPNANQADTDGDGIGDACDASTRPRSKEQCKNGGYTRFNDPTFKNQGDCIQYFNTGK